MVVSLNTRVPPNFNREFGDENMDSDFMEYLAKDSNANTEDSGFNNLRGSNAIQEDEDSDNQRELQSSNQWTFSITDERFTALFVIMPIGVAAVAGAISGIITNINDDTLNNNWYLGWARLLACSADDTKTAINRICRTVTFADVIGSSIGSIFYGSTTQINALQHTATAIWVWTGVPAVFVAAENMMKPMCKLGSAGAGIAGAIAPAAIAAAGSAVQMTNNPIQQTKP